MSMSKIKMARISVTLPPDVVAEIDRAEKNRSRFVLEAVRRELERRRRERFNESLESPHPESEEVGELGYEEWHSSAPDSDAEGLLVKDGGREIRWQEGRGWTGAEE